MAACRRALALIEKSVRSHDVVVFSKTTCSFSILAKKILRDTGVQDMKVYELERREDGQQLQVEQGGTPICIVLEFYGYVLLDGVGFYSSRLTRGVSFTSFGLENGTGSRIYRHWCIKWERNLFRQPYLFLVQDVSVISGHWSGKGYESQFKV